MRSLTTRSLVAVGVACAILGTAASSVPASTTSKHLTARVDPRAPLSHWCNTDGITCTEPLQNWKDFPFFNRIQRQGVRMGEYIGHDEPMMEFYSHRPGSGNDNTYSVTLPADPPVRPKQDGTGGTWNFQLRPTFWMGMDVCDDQSAPNPAYGGAPYPTTHCTPRSDANVFASSAPSSPRYIGKSPGGGFLELQFYPPGWVKWPAGISCDAHTWCAALNIDSFSENENTGVPNNNTCLNSAGLEPVNFAFLTKTGVAATPADPLNNSRFNVAPAKDFFMKGGDRLKVRIFDTPQGFVTKVDDLTSGTSGKMTASVANGFASVKFDPSASTCTLLPHAFHPEFSTSTPNTRLMWTAHTGNVSVADEIGHFEYCNKVDTSSSVLVCAQAGGRDKVVDPQDDNFCLPIPGLPSSLIHVTGCLGILGDSDIDFDGVSYTSGTWPGSIANATTARRMTSTPITFTSPTTRGGGFAQAAFEADLPRIEDFRPDAPFGGVKVNCQRFIRNPGDPHPGRNCVDPPPQSQVYPFFVAASAHGGCVWKEVGGLHIPGVLNAFGGGPKPEFGGLLDTSYPTSPAGAVTQRFNNFHRTLSGNPCPA